MASSDLNVIGYSRIPSPSNHLSSLSHIAVVTVIVLAVAVTVSLAFYFFLRYRHRFLRRSSPSSTTTSTTTFSSTNRISPETASSSVAGSLPAFTFSSVTRRSAASSSGGADCAVCLSKFEQHDLLRLLPLCCHAFHAECIDTWLRSNLTCPLCRSAVAASESDLAKVFRSSLVAGGESFRLEIGNISSSGRRGSVTSDAAGGDGETRGRSYSVGAFEYLIEEEAEIELGNYAHRISVSGEKDDVAPLETPAESLAEEVGNDGNSNGWLKDYVDRLSNTVSFRSSGRFFGSTRLSDVVAGDLDIEANRFGEEIGEMFQWLSGV